MDRDWHYSLFISTAHTIQHFFRSIIPPLIPVLTVDLGLPLWQLGGLISIYSLASGFGQAPYGELSDRFDRRLVLGLGMLVMAVGFGAFGVAPAIGAYVPSVVLFDVAASGVFLVMSVAMFVGGLGAAVTHPLGYPLISANVSDERKGRALGIWGSAAKLGDSLAPAVVGVAILWSTWDQIMLAAGVVGVAYALVFMAVLGRTSIETLPPGRLGGEVDDEGADAAEGAGSGVLDAVDRRVFVYPIIIVLLFFIARGAATKGVNTFVPVFITDVYGYSLTAFGVTMGPESLASFYFSALLVFAGAVQLVAGGLTDRYDHRTVIVAFFLVAAAGLTVLATVRLGPLGLLTVLFIVGAGIWGSNPARDTLISNISPDEIEGRAFGYVWTISGFIGTIWPIGIGLMAEVMGIQNAFGFLAISALVSAGVVALLFSDRVYVEAERLAGATETTD